MKLMNPRLIRTAAMLASAAALAGGLTTAATAPAYASTLGDFQWCDFLNANVGIDAWTGSQWWGETPVGTCSNLIETHSNSTVRIDFFLNNESSAFDIGHIYVSPGDDVSADFFGDLNAIDEEVTSGPI